MNEKVQGKEELENLYSTIVDSIDVEVHIWKLIRDNQKKIISWSLVHANPLALSSWGKKLSDVKGKRTEEIFVDADPVNLFMPIVEKIFANQTSHTWQTYFQATNQILEMKSIPVGEYFISTGTDVTAKIQTEKFIKQAHRLDSLGAVMGGVVHDLRNFLTLIAAGAFKLSKKYKEDEDKKIIGQIQQACKNSTELIGNILSYSKGQEEKSEEFNLIQELENVTQLLESSLPKNVEIQLNHETEMPIIKGRRINLNQVFFNISNNGIRAMEENGGVLTVSTSTINLSKDQIPQEQSHIESGEFNVVKISDSGEGISPEHLKHIFKPFFSLNQDSGGTGLGLSLVDSIVKEHGGFITVESEVGKGTEFTIHLPV